MSLLSGSDWSFQMGEVDVHYEGNFNWILYDNWAGGSHLSALARALVLCLRQNPD